MEQHAHRRSSWIAGERTMATQWLDAWGSSLLVGRDTSRAVRTRHRPNALIGTCPRIASDTRRPRLGSTQVHGRDGTLKPRAASYWLRQIDAAAALGRRQIALPSTGGSAWRPRSVESSPSANRSAICPWFQTSPTSAVLEEASQRLALRLSVRSCPEQLVARETHTPCPASRQMTLWNRSSTTAWAEK